MKLPLWPISFPLGVLVALHVMYKHKSQFFFCSSLGTTNLVLHFPDHCSNKWIPVEAYSGVWDMGSCPLGVPPH